MEALDTLEGKISCRSHPKSSLPCTKGKHGPMQQTAALPTECRSESEGLCSDFSWLALMDEWPQLEDFSPSNKVETEHRMPSPVSMRKTHCTGSSPSLQKLGTRSSFGTGHQSHVGDILPQQRG